MAIFSSQNASQPQPYRSPRTKRRIALQACGHRLQLFDAAGLTMRPSKIAAYINESQTSTANHQRETVHSGTDRGRLRRDAEESADAHVGIQIGSLKHGWMSRTWRHRIANRESRIARFPESQAWNRQKFRSEKQKNESNCSKVKSRKLDSESPSESHPINA